MFKVYVCHKYGGDNSNKEKVENIIKELVQLEPKICYLNPITSFGYLYDSTTYEDGMDYCLELLKIADLLLYVGVEGEESKGVLIEKKWAEDNGLDFWTLDEYKAKLNEWLEGNNEVH